MKHFIGIDIGYLNMGIAVCQVQDNLSLETLEVLHVARINLRYLPGQALHEEVGAFVKNFITPHLTHNTTILLERQPPTGLTSIEYLILYILTQNPSPIPVVRVSPVSLHKHFGIRHLTYEKRKTFIEQHVTKYILDPPTKETYDNLDRKHDVADAILFCLFHCGKNKQQQVFNNPLDDEDVFEKFRFRHHPVH